MGRPEGWSVVYCQLTEDDRARCRAILGEGRPDNQWLRELINDALEARGHEGLLDPPYTPRSARAKGGL